MVDPESKEGSTFNCPECGAPLRRREGKMGPFWGCSEFPKCRATLNDTHGKPSKDVDDLYRCPLCTRRLVRAAPEKGDYWFCSGYSSWAHAISTRREVEWVKHLGEDTILEDVQEIVPLQILNQFEANT